MTAPATIPVEVSPEAAARIEELGMSKEFEAMIEHTKQTVAGLHTIQAGLYGDPYEPGEPRIVITAWKDGPGTVDDRTRGAWVDWYVETFSPNACRWFSFQVDYRTDHGR